MSSIPCHGTPSWMGISDGRSPLRSNLCSAPVRRSTALGRDARLYSTRAASEGVDPERDRVGPTVHTLRVSLRDVEPTVWRRIVVPSEIKVPKLGRWLEAAMGWE